MLQNCSICIPFYTTEQWHCQTVFEIDIFALPTIALRKLTSAPAQYLIVSMLSEGKPAHATLSIQKCSAPVVRKFLQNPKSYNLQLRTARSKNFTNYQTGAAERTLASCSEYAERSFVPSSMNDLIMSVPLQMHQSHLDARANKWVVNMMTFGV